jgi:hypothetical protein
VLVARAQKRKHRGASTGGAKTKPEEAETDAADGADSSGPGTAAAEPQDAAPRPRAARDADDDGEGSAESGGEGSKKKAGRPKVVMERTAEAPEPPESRAPTSALELGVGAMALFRQLVWTSNAGLGPYSLTPGPEAGVWLEFYPGAFVTDGFGANVGLIARYDYGFGVTSTTASGSDVATKYQDFLAGLKLRMPLGMFTPNLSVAYGAQGFKLTAQQTPQDLPAMDYTFVRIGAGTRVQVTPAVAIDVAAAFLTVTNPGTAPGEVAYMTYFPRTKAYAIDAGASVALRVANAVGVRAGVDLRQYGLAFHPATGDARIVAGAVDRYIVAFAGLEVVLDGRGAGASTGGAAVGEDGEEGGGEPPPKKAKRRHGGDDDEPAKEADPSDEDS